MFRLILLLVISTRHARGFLDTYSDSLRVQWPDNFDAALPDLYEASIRELQIGLDGRRFTSVDLVKAYVGRIEEVNLRGAQLHAIQEINPSALSQAAFLLDEERRLTGTRGLLHGIPILLKDNIATIASEGMNTTAGSYSLLGSVVTEDSGVVKRLRKAGAIILGKTTMSEFAGYRGQAAEGWSGIGGQCANAYYPNTNPCGSSAGSGVAVSIGLATVALGTETDGSISCPSSFNNLAGIKPTVGLTSRAGVIPISFHQDSVGPMARWLEDAAIVLNAIAGVDPNDNYTLSQPESVPDYTKALRKDALHGKRIGVPRKTFFEEGLIPQGESIVEAFEDALDVLRSLGATVIDPADIPSSHEMRESESEEVTADVEFKIGLNDYYSRLASNPSGVRTLAELIAFNLEHKDLEMPEPYTDQSELICAEATSGYNATYFDHLSKNIDIGRTRGIDAAIQEHDLDALVIPQTWFSSQPAALAGYPIVTVPLGFMADSVIPERGRGPTVYPAPGVPFGLYFFASAFSDFELIGMAYAYEQATKMRLARKAYPEAIPRTQLWDVLVL
ncbi:amidase signature enzyme [Hymenopellis radicata]|nr:amidase signature enzyme [Hymenopellis radicata]